MKRFCLWIGSVGLAAFGAMGCGADAAGEVPGVATAAAVTPGTEDPGAAAEAAASVGELVGKAASFFEVAFSTPPDPNTVYAYQFIAPTTHVCVLSRVTGDFDTNGISAIKFFPNSAPGFPAGWYGRGRGGAICAAWTSFPRGPGNWTNMVSPIISATMNFAVDSYRPGRCGREAGFNPSVACADAWQGDAFITLSGVLGEMQGGGEWARVDQNPVGSGFNRLAVIERTESGLTAWAQAIFVGAPSIFRPVLLFGRNAQGQSVRGFARDLAVSTFSVSSSGTRSQLLAPSADALCALTRVSGNFDGGGESVRITEVTSNGVKFWQLTAAAGGGSAYGSARCMSYLQLVL